MAIFNESGNLITAGASSVGNVNLGKYENSVRALNNILEGAYYEVNGYFEYAQYLTEAEDSEGKKKFNIKELPGMVISGIKKAIEKLVDLWYAAIEVFRNLPQRAIVNANKKKIEDNLKAFIKGEENIDIGEKNKAKLNSAIKKYKSVQAVDIDGMINTCKNGVEAYRTCLGTSKAENFKDLYAQKIGQALVGNAFDEDDYKSKIDSKFGSDGQFSVDDVIKTASSIDKLAPQCKKIGDSIKSLEKDLDKLDKAASKEDRADLPNMYNTSSDLTSGARYGIVVLTYFNNKVLSTIRTKVTACVHICMAACGGKEIKTDNLKVEEM